MKLVNSQSNDINHYNTGAYAILTVNIMLFMIWWRIPDYIGCAGKGHIKSLASSGQNSLRLLCRYHFLSSECPDGLIIGGRSSFDDIFSFTFITCIFYIDKPWIGGVLLKQKWLFPHLAQPVLSTSSRPSCTCSYFGLNSCWHANASGFFLIHVSSENGEAWRWSCWHPCLHCMPYQ